MRRAAKEGVLYRTKEFAFGYEDLKCGAGENRFSLRKGTIVISFGESGVEVGHFYERVLTPFGAFWTSREMLETLR